MAYQSKKYRKFVATAATATLVASAVAPAAGFAAEETKEFSDVKGHWGEKAVNYLVGKNAIKGYEDGTFNPNGEISRAEAATVLAGALGLTIDEDAKTTLSDAKDHWASKYIAALQAQKPGVINGFPDGTFKPEQKISRQDMAKMIVAAYPELKLDESAVVSFTDKADYAEAQTAINILASLGVANGKGEGKFAPKANVTRAETATFVHRTEVPAERLQVETTEAKVVSVSAINATQVEVKFSRALVGTDFDTQAEAATVFKLSGETIVSADLGSDNKTVTLTFNDSVEGTNKELVVEPVLTPQKDANNQPVLTKKYVQVFNYTDTVKPEIVSVTSSTKDKAATSLTVVASEPIQSALAKVNGSYVTINFNGSDTATVTGLNLDVSKQHTLELINLTDKAATPNVTVATSRSFSVVVDATSPTVSVSTASEREILLTFSKKMSEATLEAAFAANGGLGLVKDELLANVQLSSYGAAGFVKEVAGSNGTKFTVNVGATLFTNKTTRNLTVLLPDSITDSLGNKIVVTTLQVVLTKDTAKPVATGYQIVKNTQGQVTHIEVTFSEGLAGGTTPALPTIVNENGVAISAAVGAGNFLGGLVPQVTTAGDKKVVYAATTAAKLSGTYALSFGPELVSDLAETANKADAFNYTINFGTDSSTFNLASATALNNAITVNFGTAVRGGAVANSATDVNNYTVAGKPLPAGTNITLNTAQTIATIVLPGESIEVTDNNAIFTVANVKSLNGASLNSYAGTLAVVDNTKPVLNAATLTGDNLLSVGFNEALGTNPAISDFVIKVNGSTVTQVSTGAGTTLTVTPGTGSDAGKYLINLDDLIIQGASATPGPATETFFDVNNNGVYDAGVDIKIGDGPVASFKFTSSPLITGVTVSTLAVGNSTAKDAGNLNFLKNGVTVTAK